ncbi:hypothetical protein PC111_g4204 [Phytophthora cactorum]|nr:hypothetical protein PC111_g4204 [Phytophthora cactorum]
MVHRVKDKNCTLSTDPWTNVNGKNIISYILNCGKDDFLLETLYTRSASHSATVIAADIRHVIKFTKFANIVAVVTDNTSANQLVWQTLQTAYPHIFFHGCISHVIYLAINDLVARLLWLNSMEGNYRKSRMIFQENQQLWTELRRLQQFEGKKASVLLADTHWGTIEKCFTSLLESEAILHAFVSGTDFLKVKTEEQKVKRQMGFDVVRSKDFVSHLERQLPCSAPF